jgi:FlaA1/EpsC-like NDP-sugar epimerase
MTLDQAANLVVSSTFLAKGGEVFVTKMPVVRIVDVAHVMIEELAPKFGFKPEDIKVHIIGAKAGEKLYEELITDEETRRVMELDDYYVVTPAFRSVYRDVDYSYDGVVEEDIEEPYNSDVATAMTREETRTYLIENNLLEDTE